MTFHKEAVRFLCGRARAEGHGQISRAEEAIQDQICCRFSERVR